MSCSDICACPKSKSNQLLIIQYIPIIDPTTTPTQETKPTFLCKVILESSFLQLSSFFTLSDVVAPIQEFYFRVHYTYGPAFSISKEICSFWLPVPQKYCIVYTYNCSPCWVLGSQRLRVTLIFTSKAFKFRILKLKLHVSFWRLWRSSYKSLNYYLFIF